MPARPAENPAPGFQKNPSYRLLIGGKKHKAQVKLSDVKIAESSHAICVSEATYGDVIYFPRDHVDLTKLTPTETSSYCPFKGTASYWRVSTEGETGNDSIDICWSYEDPFDEMTAIAGYIAFYSDRVNIINL